MKQKELPSVIPFYRWLLIGLAGIAVIGLLSLFFYTKENAAIIDLTFTIGICSAIAGTFLWGFYYIVKAACIYIDKNEPKD